MKRQSNITDAEWQIMRMIWSSENTTSSQIIARLGKSKSWSPTTVKTLLARLVKKEVISFHMQGRTRLYYPLMTEMECVRREMNNVIMRLYGQTVNQQSEHFTFYGHNDSSYISLLASELEYNYGKILNILGIVLDEKIMVYTHETQLQLHSALGVQSGPGWLRAGSAWGIMHIAPKKCFDNIKAEKAAVHVFAQIVINKLNPATPYWLMQGYSAYLAKWLELKRIKDAVREQLDAMPDISLDDISSDYEKFNDNKGYELAYTIAHFIVLEYGAGHMALLIKSPYDYEGIFNCTKERFQKKWLGFLHKKYMGVY